MWEVWKTVVGFEGLYEVSNWGRVRSLVDNHGKRRIQPKVLKSAKNEWGYHRVVLCNKYGKKNFFVHCLVAKAFLDNHQNLPFINHKDENPSNNCVWNLEWCTQKYNINYGTRTERMAKARVNHPALSRRVLQYDLKGNLIREWPSVKEVHRQTGWNFSNIANCCRQLPHHKTVYGFVWRYAD